MLSSSGAHNLCMMLCYIPVTYLSVFTGNFRPHLQLLALLPSFSLPPKFCITPYTKIAQIFNSVMLAVNTCNGLKCCLFWTTYNLQVFFSDSAFRHAQKVQAHTSCSTTYLPVFIPLLKPLNLQAHNRNQINNETMFKTELNDRLIGQRIGQRRINGEAANFNGPKTRGDRGVCDVWYRTPSESTF